MTILIGSATLLVCLGIQLAAVIMAIRRIMLRMESGIFKSTFAVEFMMLGEVMLVLFAGNLLQVSIWACLFMMLGEFTQLGTAFYHSMVNFSSLGYGDIVMSEQWRLLGALEAGSGVTMFGMTTGAVMAALRAFLQRHAEDRGFKGKAR